MPAVGQREETGPDGGGMHLLPLDFKCLHFDTTFFFILSGSTETTHRTPAPVQLLKHRETHRKCDLLTYLLSFFSGGDFLSQPWKRISPPLMFVAVFCLLSLYKRPSVT